MRKIKHKDLKDFICKGCGKTFDTNDEVFDHYAKNHFPKEFREKLEESN